jgi:hypothetical protein
MMNLYGCLSVCTRQLVYHANINATIDRMKSRRRWNLLVVARETCSWWCGRYRYRRKSDPVFDLVGFSTPLAAAKTWLVAGAQNQEEPYLNLGTGTTCFASWLLLGDLLRATEVSSLFSVTKVSNVFSTRKESIVFSCNKSVECVVVQQKCRTRSQELKSSQYLFLWCWCWGVYRSWRYGTGERSELGRMQNSVLRWRVAARKTKGVCTDLNVLVTLPNWQVGLCGSRKTESCVVASGSQQELERRGLEEEGRSCG